MAEEINLDDFFMFNEDDNLYSPNDDPEENKLFYHQLVDVYGLTPEEAKSVINLLKQ